MKRSTSVIHLIVSTLLIVSVASAQDATFDASVDKNPVGMGDQFTLTLRLSNAGVGGGKNLQLPDLGKFHMMGGPNQSTSMQFINGAVSSSITYSYILQPKEVGKFTIGAASIEVGGTLHKTAPIALEVVKGAPQQHQQNPAQQDDVTGQISDNLFLRASVDKSNVMLGEQINLVFKLYTRVSVANYSVDKNPALTGFWGEDIENPKNISLTTETVNGKQYRVGIIRRMALFPTQSGTLEISPMQVQTVVQVQSRSVDPFDAFFRDPFGRNVNYPVKSDPIKIKVEPLPPGAPSSFKGAVGKFTMNTSVDKRTTKTNEPITLKVTISGTGNVKLLESPEVDLPTDFERYSPKVADDIKRGEGKIAGTKSFEYLLIPRYPGQKVVKPVAFSYFDLAKREYVTLRSPEIELTVEQGTAPLLPPVAGTAREDVRLLSQDIRFIKVGAVALRREGEAPYKSATFLVLLALPLMGLAGVFLFVRQREAIMMDASGYRNRRAMKVARRGLKQAELMLQKGPMAGSAQGLAFYSEVSRALWKYLGDKLDIQQAELSIESTLAELAIRNVNGEISRTLKSLLESCEMARFAPTALTVETMKKTYEEARDIIMKLERTLKSR